MTIFSRLVVSGLVLVLFFTSNAHADTELENAALARVITVLNSLTPLINEAERQQDKTARVQFQYNQLRQDINQIKIGIAEKLQTQAIEPREVKSIQGDYLAQRGKHS